MAAGRVLRIAACLSLTGRYARFGVQAATALRVWERLQSGAEVSVEDDRSDPDLVREILPGLASRADVVLGPYSTQLMKAAAPIAAERDLLVWNHGGAGDDAQSGRPGHVVSVLTPASRYAEPFISLVAARRMTSHVSIVVGRGAFARQVAAGAERSAREAGLSTGRLDARDPDAWRLPAGSAVISVGTFEDDVRTVEHLQRSRDRPRAVLSAAAGVRDFADAVLEPEGVYGVAQWWPGVQAGLGVHTGPGGPALPPSEDAFLAEFRRATGRADAPDYPAIQAVAAAVIATHCAMTAGDLDREALWNVATGLEATTLFGAYGVDPSNGVQLAHRTVLTHWTDGAPAPVASPG